MCQKGKSDGIHHRQWWFLHQGEFCQIVTGVKKRWRVVWNEKAQSVGGTEGRPTPTQAAASSYQLILTTGKSFPGYCAILNSDAIPELFGSTFQENFDHQLYFASRCNIRIGAVPCNSRTNTYTWRNIVLEQLQSKMTIFCPTVCRSNQCCLCVPKFQIFTIVLHSRESLVIICSLSSVKKNDRATQEWTVTLKCFWGWTTLCALHIKPQGE